MQHGIAKLSKDAKDLITGLKPYRTGNDLLWSINRANNLDKHEKLISVAIDIGSVEYVWSEPSQRIRQLLPEGDARFSPLKGEILLFNVGREAKLPFSPRVRVHVAFCDVEPIEGKDIVATLDRMTNVLEGAIESAAKLP
ncbi:MAG: hypothetical protein WAN59_12765 [Candidatus Baltobacteraceae bacterium]